MKISVFGGSQPKPEDSAYAEAYDLGLNLGKAGHTVLTGGYIGTMEAVSLGASTSGGHVIGVTCDQIEAWRPVCPNEWIDEEWRYPTVRQRLYTLIEACDAAIALPGGIGTLAEISVMWNHIQTQSLPCKPLILVGSGWQKLFSDFFINFDGYMKESDKQIISYASNIDQAILAVNNLIKFSL